MRTPRQRRPRLTVAEERLYRQAQKMFRSKKYALRNPTHDEIAEKIGVTRSVVTKGIHQLVAKGYGINPRGKMTFELVD